MVEKIQIITKKKLRIKTLWSFFLLLLFILSCIAGWKWLFNQPKDNAALKPLRAVMNTNGIVFSTIFSNTKLTKTYPKKAVVPFARVNGKTGLEAEFDTTSWKLQLIKDNTDTLFISLEEIRSLPKMEIIFDFKCIEGWSQITHWGGVRFSDFIKKFGLEKESRMQFSGLKTPDGEYYVGVDNKSMMHPQTLLCYEINGRPLPLNQGYPLRLIIPVKYGIKHLKRIGTLFFSDERPPDYWYERGYDYNSGL